MEALRNVPEQFNNENVESNFLENTNNHLKMENKREISEKIFLCVKDGHISNVESLLQNSNVDPNLQTEYGETPLIVASTWGQKDMVRLLLEHGADLNLQTEQGTALMVASMLGDLDMVAFLLKRGADPDIQWGEYTALDFASMLGELDVVRLLS